jgi:hypothetical protein
MPSTVVADITYEASTGDLTITYTSGQAYKYKGVPEQIYKELKASRVKGRYLRFFVKDNFAFEKISGY